jgi:EmrB/QacA subfamily drug resistance transporter
MKRSRWLGILGVALGEALIGVNFSIVSTSLPTIQKVFQASFSDLQWMLNIFGIFICATLASAGRLADTYGRRRLFLIGLIGSGLASLIAGLAPHQNWIIFAQAVQGVMGAILLAISQALMCQFYPAQEKGRAIGLWAAIAGIVLGMGPLLSGVLITLISWRSIFLINVPVAIFAIFLTFYSVEESKSSKHRSELDYKGMFLLMLLIASLVLGIMQGHQWGWTSASTLLCLGFFVVSLPLLIYIESRADFPIIHPEFFLKKDFLLPSLCNFCMITFLWTAFFLFPLYFQDARGFSPLATGLLMLICTLPVALLSSHVGKWSIKVGQRLPILIGFALLALSISIQFSLQPESSMAIALAMSLTFGAGWVLIWGPTTTAALSSLPRDLAGIASGAFTTVQEVGATVGLAITGTLFRLSPHPFMDGYRNSLWALLAFTGVGLIAAYLMKRNQTSRF